MSAADQLLNALKETLRSTGKPKRFVADVAAVLAAYGDLEQTLGSTQNRWEGMQQALSDRAHEAERSASLARTLLSRAREFRGALARAREAIEGLRLTALSAGLEGARQTEAGSHALLRLSDEVRSGAVQALESLDELVASLDQADRDREKLLEATAELTRELGVVTGRVDGRGRSSSAADDPLELGRVGAALRALGQSIEKATGTDPELAPLLAAAAEHARGLATALSQLGARDGARLALRSLQPLLEPLVSVLGEIYGSGREER